MAFRTPLGSRGTLDNNNSMVNSMVNSMAAGLAPTVNLSSSMAAGGSMAAGLGHTNDQIASSITNNMATGSLGQFGLVRKPAELSPGSRKTVTGLPTPPAQQQPLPPGSQAQSQQQQQQNFGMQMGKTRKSVGVFGEEEDQETSMYFPNSSSMFRPDKEMMQSQSPSQLSGFANFYSQGFSIQQQQQQQQRGTVTGSQFQRNNAPTPTSINPNFPPIGIQQNSPNRNMISAIGQQRMMSNTQTSQSVSSLQKRPIGSGLTSNSAPISSLSSTFGFSQSRGSDSSQPNFDLSEFPLLGNRVTTSSNSLPGQRNYVGMVSKQVQEQTPEFQIQQEDFPALPGAQSTLSIFVSDPPTSMSSDPNRKQPMNLISGSSYEQALNKDSKYPGDSKQGPSGQRKGVQVYADGRVTNIPQGMVTDQFGIAGLLSFIKAAETDPNLVALAPGMDLTTLGLNLNSPDNLYSTFQSPWVDLPCRPQDIDFHVPAEYLTNIFVRDRLAPIKLNRYGEDLLFFLFYMNGGDVLQLAAAMELFNRDWRYHKEERVWITRAPGVDPIVKTNTYERGTYFFYDAKNWRKVAKEFHLEYDKLEERPTFPPPFPPNHNPNQPNN